VEELEVELKLYHPAKEDLTSETVADHSKKWSFVPVFLNYQGFVVEWKRKPVKRIHIGKIVQGDP
jgi:hypothetical protein